MSLMTTAEVKAFLRETSSTYDTLIATYIPIIEQDMCTYLNNWFQDPVVYIKTSAGLAFTKGTTGSTGDSRDKIVDDNQKFSTAGLSSGMDVAISGGSNYGIRTISSGQTSATLYMTGAAEFIDQDQDASYNTVGGVKIARVIWPDALKPIAAKMIWSQISDNKPGNAAQERIDDYSITYVNGHAYPERVMRQLDKWKQARMR